MKRIKDGCGKMEKEIKRQLIEHNKHRWFVEHIERHLNKKDKVICKICNKSVDEIAEETLDDILNNLNKAIG
jgi:Uri superfamily endonuclease